MSSDVRFRILGSVGVSLDGTPLTVGAARQRALLALLLLDANRRVHPHLLIDGIWGESFPQHPEAALQIVVSRLRANLGALAERVSSDPSGYRLEVGDDELDLLRARAHYTRAQALSAEHDEAGAAAAAEAALACWSSDALADLRDAPFYDAAHRELRELRFSIYELRNRAFLRCGRHVEVLVDVDSWIRSDPWRERLRAHQMIALYRAGKRVEALAAYADLARCLEEDLGVEPSHFTQELRTRIVEQDPELLAHRAGIVAPLPAWTPRSLPFVGRAQEETRICDCLRAVAAGSSRMVLIEGEAGIGKSRLALETARRVHDEAIVLAVDGADALRPGMHMIAAALAEASSQLSDTELRLCLGRWPGDVAELVPSLRRRLPDLPPALDADDETRAARLRAAIVSWIGALSLRAPVLLILDDVHRAGPALLLLIGAVLVDEEPKRVLVLATARSGVGDRSSRLERLARSLEQRGLFERMTLAGLTPEAVGRLLEELAVPDAAKLAVSLIVSTRGHPYLLGEMLHEVDRGAPARAVDDTAGRIREFVLRRVAALDDATAHLLSIAAALDGEFDVKLLNEIAHGTDQSTAVMVDQATTAGLLHVTGLGSFDFVHDLARRAIVDATDWDERGAMHGAIATVLERRGAAAALVASQWSRAAGAVADAKTIEWAERAGDTALRALDPHAAAAWFRLAATRADDPRTRAHLLIRLAGAQCQSGDDSGADNLRTAVGLAHDLDDDDLLLEAATLTTPIWASMPALSHRERIELLNMGAARTDDAGVRARLLARLATEVMFSSDGNQSRTLAERARTEARRANDPAVLPEVLMRHFQATCTPHNLDERRRYMHTAVEIADAAHDPVQRFFALSTSASAAIEAGERDEAEEFLGRLFRLGAEVDVPVLTYSMECIRVWRAGLDGDLEEAERRAVSAMEIGQASGITNATIGPSMQIGCIRWEQARFEELLPVLRMRPNTEDPSGSLLLARALAGSDRTRGEAAALLVQTAEHDFADVPLNLNWAGAMVAAAEAAFLLREARVARVVLAHLSSFCDRVAFNGTWVIAPLAFAAGVAAAAAPGVSAAIVDEYFERALAVCDRLRAPALRARTELIWSQVLDARGAFPGKVVSLVEDARDDVNGRRVDQ